MRWFVPAALALALVSLAGCGDKQPEKPRPVLVIGIDAADWSVIESLWSEGELPHLRALADRGVRATLLTGYNSISAVVWSTIATGVKPERHGITDFVVATDKGNVPVSSKVRKVPALWNMVSTAGRRVAVLAWWATWPAESVNGVVLTDRIGRDLENTFSPPDWAPEVEAFSERARDVLPELPPSGVTERDRLVSVAALELLDRDYDLTLAYFKSVDEVGHRYWKYFRPANFQPIPEEEMATFADYVPRAYRSIDTAVGRLVAAAGPETNIFVLSDHGFYSLKRERIRVRLDLDGVLEHLGFLSRNESEVDLSRTRVYTHATPDHRLNKKVRFALAGREEGGAVEAGERGRVRRELAAALGRLRYSSGARAFEVTDAGPAEAEAGADFVVRVLSREATDTLLDGDARVAAPVALERVSGSHGGSSHGIFIAAGPDIDLGGQAGRLTIHDITPTLLLAMGLPTAEDFDGKAHEWLFSEDFRRRFPPRTIASWGTRGDSEAVASEADEELIRELRALGYLD